MSEFKVTDCFGFRPGYHTCQDSLKRLWAVWLFYIPSQAFISKCMICCDSEMVTYLCNLMCNDVRQCDLRRMTLLTNLSCVSLCPARILWIFYRITVGGGASASNSIRLFYSKESMARYLFQKQPRLSGHGISTLMHWIVHLSV